MKILKIALLLWAGLAMVPWSALAAEFRVAPGIALRQEYDDNILLTNQNQQSDFITTISPSLLLDWQTRYVDLALNLGLTYEKYLRNSERDDLRPSQGAALNSTWSLYRNSLFLRLADVYQRVAIDESGRGGVDNTLINLTDSNRFTANPYLLLDLMPTLQARVDYRYENLWYEADAGNSAETHLTSLQLTQELTPRLTASAYGGLTQYRPKDANTGLVAVGGGEEYDRQDLRFDLRWQFTERFSLAGNIGQTKLEYVQRGTTDSTLSGGEANYQISEDYVMGTGYQEDISDSVNEGARQGERIYAFLRYADRSSVNLNVFRREDRYLEIDRFDTVYGASLSGDTPLANRKGVTWLLSYSDFDDAIENERYQRYGARVALYHELRLGRMSLGYTRNQNQSDLDLNDYTNNIIFADLVLRF